MAPSLPRRENDADPVSDDLGDLERSLSALAVRAWEAIGSGDGLGVTVEVGHDLVLGQSNAFARTVDAVQYGLMEGPCVQAQTTGHQVRSADIGTGEQRWPRFTQRAAAVGLRSVVSTPLLAADRPIGSLNLYGSTTTSLSALRPAALTVVAGAVADSLRSPVLLARTRATARWFARAVQDRAAVERAVGVLMHRYRLSSAEAQVLIQQLAHEDDVSEVVAAWTVIDQDSA